MVYIHIVGWFTVHTASESYYRSYFEEEMLLSTYTLYQSFGSYRSYPGTLAAQNFTIYRLILHVLHCELNKSNLWSHFKRHRLPYESQRSRSERIVWDALVLQSSRFLIDDLDLPWELENFFGCVLGDQKKRQTSGMTSRKIRKTISTV